MKDAYLGEYTPKFKLDTDFRQYTSLAQLQAIGRGGTSTEGGSPSYSYGSFGFRFNAGYTNTYGGIYAKLPFKIASGDRIYMRYTGYGRGTNGVNMQIGTHNRGNLQDTNSHEFGYGMPTGTRSNMRQGISGAKNVNGTKTWGINTIGRYITSGDGEFCGEVRIDLINNTVRFRTQAPTGIAYEMSTYLTTDGLNAIIGNEYFFVWGANYDSPQNQDFYTATIIIE